ncbi:hypothetical protein MJO28_015678 [Puccinia striiformis f. sp. tritici]|uniref:Uncharacterized protein n=1 Tax=Puccinia striiformis f. sp. tritici TaxID=168172 RepID=A0ACC0DR27_9BASI|nr:hypothetical protein MJO28_015678 [Puccinia striiformis f. sp. tritici]
MAFSARPVNQQAGRRIAIGDQSSEKSQSIEAAKYKQFGNQLDELEKCFELSNDQIKKQFELLLNQTSEGLLKLKPAHKALQRQIDAFERSQVPFSNELSSIPSQTLQIVQKETSLAIQKTHLELDKIISKLKNDVHSNRASIDQLQGSQDDFQKFQGTISKNLDEVKDS